MQFRLVWIAGIFGFASFASAQFVYEPASLPFNTDIVHELGGTTTSQLGFNGEALVTQGYAEANDPTDPKGLPNDGHLVVDGIPFQLGPYNGNNAVKLTRFLPDPNVATAVTLRQYTQLHLLAVAGSGRYRDA